MTLLLVSVEINKVATRRVFVMEVLHNLLAHRVQAVQSIRIY